MKNGSFMMLGAVTLAAGVLAAPAAASEMQYYADGSGLSAEAEFTLLNATTLEIRLKNTSSALPGGMGGMDAVLSSLSWDFGVAGSFLFDARILTNGSSVKIGDGSSTVNFDSGTYGAGDDVSGEYGYSNSGGAGLMQNFITVNHDNSVAFNGANLHGSPDLTDAEGGLISDNVVPAGIAAIQREIITTLTLDRPVSDLGFISANGTTVEFGNGTVFLDGTASQVPGPGALALLGLGLAASRRRRR